MAAGKGTRRGMDRNRRRTITLPRLSDAVLFLMRHLPGIAWLLLALTLMLALQTGTAAQDNAEAHQAPIIDGGIGSCSVQFEVTDTSQKPVYAAKVSVRLAYGFMKMHKLDLQAATNIDGKVRFVGLSAKATQPLEFHARKNDAEGVAVVDLSKDCKSEHTIVLQKGPSSTL